MLETARLLLRPLAAADLDAFVAYRRDPDVARYQSWETSFSRAEAEAVLMPGEWAQVAIADRASGALLGDCAVHTIPDQPATTEVGVTLAPASQGRGIATEALRALIGSLFADRGMHRVLAHADDRNVAVHRVLERVGMRCEARLVEADWFKGEWTTLRIYALLAREWRG